VKRTYKAADGETITVDDTVTLLGPSPNLSGCTQHAKVARGVRSIYFPDGKPERDPHSLEPVSAASGYSNPVDDPEYLKLWSRP
jgi:hypothetical protein